MSVMKTSYNMEIPREILTWGESHLKPDSLYRVVGEQLYTFISWEELHSMYSSTGRPGINPVILSLVTIFQFLEDVPDRVAASFVETRLDWKYALHLPLDDSGFHYSDLCNFRKRLYAHDKATLIFDQLLEKIRSMGYLKKRKHQRSDSTHVLAKVCHLSRLENLSEGLRLALGAIEQSDSIYYQEKLPSSYRERWEVKLNDYRMTDKEREESLNRIGHDIHWLLNILAGTSFVELPEVDVLSTLFAQNFTVESQKIHLREDCVDCKEKIQTPHDPEARYATKRDTHWTGYKIHVTETANDEGEVNFITDITTSNASERDNEALSQIQENTASRDVKPEEQYVDKAYVTGDNLADSQEHGIHLMGEASPLTNKGLFTADDFIIDTQAMQATCPSDCKSTSWNQLETGKFAGDIQISFGSQCQTCPWRDKCTTNKTGRKMRISQHHNLMKQRRAESMTDSFREAMKRRPPIEGTISEMVRSHGLRRSRYKGILKTHFQNLLIGAAMNLKRLVKVMELSKSSASSVPV
jgi:transposase